MTIDAIVATEIMRRRIDRIADSRERRDTRYGMGPGLGVGFYAEWVRSDAAAVAAAWLAAAGERGVTLDDLDGCTDLASGALDAVQGARRRLART